MVIQRSACGEQNAAEGCGDAALVAACFFMIFGRISDAEQRREEHGDDPGHDQRDGDDDEQREGEFAGRGAVEADRE